MQQHSLAAVSLQHVHWESASVDELAVLADDMRVSPLYKHIFPPAVAPSLAFIGILWKSLRFPQFELQVGKPVPDTLCLCTSTAGKTLAILVCASCLALYA